MRKNRVLCGIVLFVAVLLSVTQATFAQSTPKINVKARSAEERSLLSRAVSDAYPLLPKSQQALIGQGLFFVAYYDEPLVNWAAAFGPEDDPDYRYPDKTLYPKGTIKVNINPEELDVMRAAYKADDPTVREVLKHTILDVLGHEITHVEQYMQDPVQALSVAADCPNGLCDERKAEGTRRKVIYEFEAMKRGHAIGIETVKREDWDYASQWLKNHPDLAKGTRAEFLKNGLTDEDFENPLPDQAKMFYASMYLPVVLAKSCATGGLNEEEMSVAQMILTANQGNDHFLEKIYPHLTPVFQRLSSCLARTPVIPAPSTPAPTPKTP